MCGVFIPDAGRLGAGAVQIETIHAISGPSWSAYAVLYEFSALNLNNHA